MVAKPYFGLPGTILQPPGASVSPSVEENVGDHDSQGPSPKSELTPHLVPPSCSTRFPLEVTQHCLHSSHDQSVAHLGQLGSLLHAPRDVSHDIHGQFWLGAIPAHQMAHPAWAWPALEMMDLLSCGTVCRAVGRGCSA
jgi:hypothetical protein